MSYPASCRTTPWEHQLDGTRLLITVPTVAIFDDVGVGKSKQLVDAVCELYVRGEIDTFIICCPGFVRSVWAEADALLGEFAKHAWEEVRYRLHEYSVKNDRLPSFDKHRSLDIIVTNYEFLRRSLDAEKAPYKNWPKKRTWPRLLTIYEWAKGRKCWVAFDESWSIENHKSDQTVASWLLRSVCQRVTVLNGTPGTIDKQFSQIQLLHPGILNVDNFYHFRGRYCERGGWKDKAIIGYKNLEDYARRTGPYVLRRRARDVLKFLPPRLPAGIIEARLSDREWAAYTSMRDELVAWVDANRASVAAFAGTKSLRLSQIVAGFLGGVRDMADDEPDLFTPREEQDTVEIGTSKLDTLLAWVKGHDLNKLIIWGRFKPEMARLVKVFTKDLGYRVFELHGETPESDRREVKQVFAPGTSFTDKALLIGHPRAGGAGLNFASASVSIYTSNTWSLRERDQSEGRIDRPGQEEPCRFLDVVATGPKGQKTVDHHMLDALRTQTDVANWTPDQWKTVLLSE